MRRINLRKKRQIELKNINLKSLKLLSLFTALLVICLIIYCFYINNFFIKKNFEKEYLAISNSNQNIPFSIDKIILFSSATANTSNGGNSILNANISQYCDIGIYLKNSNQNNETVINSLYIDNINISIPSLGTPCLYKKSVTDLGKCSFSEDNIIQDNFYFNIITPEEQINYNNYEIYNNCSTPISLGFYNKDIKSNFILDNTEIKYDGTLLKNAIISEKNLNCSVSFALHLTTSDNMHYISNINFNVPFENNGHSLYNDGYIIQEIDNTQISNFIAIN